MFKNISLKHFLFLAVLLSIIGSQSTLRGEAIRPNVSNKNLTQPSSIQTAILLATGLKIIVPSYIPQGFTLADIEVQAERNPKNDSSSYTLFYRDRDGLNCFGIQGSNRAYLGKRIDDPNTKFFKVNSAFFGKTNLLIIPLQVNQQFMRSDWLTESPKCQFNDDRCTGMGYRLIGATDSYAQLKRCKDVSIPEAIKITESFRYLNPQKILQSSKPISAKG